MRMMPANDAQVRSAEDFRSDAMPEAPVASAVDETFLRGVPHGMRVTGLHALSSARIHGVHGYWVGFSDLLGRIPSLKQLPPGWLDGQRAELASVEGGARPLGPDGPLPEDHPAAFALGTIIHSGRPACVSGVASDGASCEWVVLPFSATGERIDAVATIGEILGAGRVAVVAPVADAPAKNAATGGDGCDALAALESIGLAVAMVRTGGRTHCINEAALDMLSAGHEIEITRSGMLAARTMQASEFLERMHASPAASFRGRLGGLVIQARPVEGGHILTMRHLEEPIDFLPTARDVFSLTPAESRIANGVAAGRTLDEIAASGSIALDTARTQLKSAMNRMGVSRQQELVRRFCLAATI